MPASPHERPVDARRLPPGRHGLSRAVVVENQRGRIFEALASTADRKGYARVTVQDIISRAGVSRRTFYDLFADKEHCFLAAYDVIADRVFGEVESAFRAGDRPWYQRLASALQALTRLYASEPALARLAMVDVLSAGGPALARRDATLERFAVFLEGGQDGLPVAVKDRALLARAVVGGLYEAIYGYVRDRQAERLGELMPDLVYCALLPYLGHRRTLEAIAAKSPS